jgi:ribosomal protein S18 acetylase RimI-like enzyme
MIEITEADIHDLLELRRLEQTCFAMDAWPLLDLIGVLSFPRIIRLRARVDGRWAGFIAAEVDSRQIGWITTLAVFPEYRRQGAANALLLACEAALPVPDIRLSVRASNQGAIQLYTRAGYTIIDRWPEYYKGNEDGLVMRHLIAK